MANNLLPRINFNDSHKYLQRISSKLENQRVVVISGSAGSGKTPLANEFAYKLQEEDKVWRSFMIFSESEHQIETALRKISVLMQLDLNNKEIYNDLLNHIKTRMQNLPFSFLIIFDDLVEYNHIEPILQKLLPLNKIKFLVTTRTENIFRQSTHNPYILNIS